MGIEYELERGDEMMMVRAIVYVLFIVFSVPAFAEDLQRATFAGGCFWCLEEPFDSLEGVVATQSGFSGGHVKNPTYRQVTYGNTGHTEVVQVTYDADKVDYQTLLDIYWRQVDPYDGGGQFCDRGSSYRPAIFHHNDEQRREIELSLDKLGKSGMDIQQFAVQIVPFDAFYQASGKHQDYYSRNPLRYKYYRSRCGRDDRLKQVWKN